MNLRRSHWLVLFAVLLGAGGWLAARFHFQQRPAKLQPAAMTRSEATSAALAPDSAPAQSASFIDLSPHFNDSLDDGWQHQLTPGNNLGPLPRGRQIFGGAEFDVQGIIQLTSRQLRRFGTRTQFPEHVQGIRVGRKCRQLQFLQATGWNSPPGTWVGSYVIHYADDTSEEAPILYGEGTGNWWVKGAGLERSRALVVWRGTNAANQPIQLFKQSWINPRPELEIKSLDFESRLTRVAPFLIAVTAE